MMEERYHVTIQNQFYPDMSNVNKSVTVEAKLISPPTYIYVSIHPVGGGGAEGLKLPSKSEFKKTEIS